MPLHTPAGELNLFGFSHQRHVLQLNSLQNYENPNIIWRYCLILFLKNTQKDENLLYSFTCSSFSA